MATTAPAALKAADISRFALRAAQLAQAKPIVSYWCTRTLEAPFGRQLISERQLLDREPDLVERPSQC